MLTYIETILITASLLTLLSTITLIIAYKLTPEKTCKFEPPAISVFIPFFNEESKILIKTLEHLESQTYPSPIQVLIIDDGSTNHSVEYVKRWLDHDRHQNYVLIEKPHNGGRKGIALDYVLDLNIAIGEVYIIVDSDTFIDPDGVINLVNKLWSNDKYAAVCGYITPSNYRDSFIGKLQHYEHISFYGAIRAAQDKLGCVPVLAGAFVAHRASAVKDIGGWSNWLVEDIAWCWKALSCNYKTGYAPQAKATTKCPTDSRSLFRQRRRWARGRVEAYQEAWRNSARIGVIATPWFVMTAMQYIFPSSLIFIGFMVMFNIWVPIVIGAINIVAYLYLVSIYIKDYSLHTSLSYKLIIKAPIFSIILETLTWLPNLLGYIDELLGRKKSWLTR